MDINILLKPLLLMNGIRDLRIRFDIELLAVIATGTQYNQPFEYRQSFAEIEAVINGPGKGTAGQEAGGLLPDTGRTGDRPA